jgi:pimeloyl-ACP methyl ester carboxylesterase
MTILGTSSSRYWRTPDGINLHYRSTEASAPWCVMVHGLADGEYIWSEVVDAIAANYRVLVLDLRGHGRSGWADDGRYNLATFTDDVVALLRDAGVDNPIIIGHSLGGDISARAASLRQVKAKALILVDAGPGDLGVDYKLIQSRMIEGCRTYISREDYLSWLKDVYPMASTASLSRIANLSLESNGAGYHVRLDARVINILEDVDDEWWWRALPMINCPVLIARGRASGVLTKPTAERMLSILRKGRLEVVSAAGHSVMVDNPSGFLGAVSRFMGEIKSVL